MISSKEYNYDIAGLIEMIDEVAQRTTDNDNTEQIIGVNEVESIVDQGVRNAIDDLDFDMLVRDYGNVDSIVEDYIYNNDICDKCWVEDELGKVHRDVRDEVLSDIREEIESTVFHSTVKLQDQIAGMQEEINYLHEKYREMYNKTLQGRMFTITDWLGRLARRVHWHMPRR